MLAAKWGRLQSCQELLSRKFLFDFTDACLYTQAVPRPLH